MRIQDFAVLALVCMIWGLNFVVTKWVVAGDGTLAGYQGLPPFFAAGLRFTLAALVLAPLLRPLPRRFPDVVMVGLLFGALHFGLLYMGLKWSTASAAAVVIQLGVPFTTMLSVFLLGERIGVRRITGIALAVAGVIVISFDPSTAQLSIGLLLVAGSAFAGALGSILVKRLDVVQPIRLQAWIGAVSALPLIVMSALFETDQVLGLMSGGWRLALAYLYIVLAVSIFAHAGYVVVLRRYDASMVAPLTLMAPLWGMVFGVALQGDDLSPRFVIGAVIAIAGVAVVARRSGVRAEVISGSPRENASEVARPDPALAKGEAGDD